MSNFFKKSLKFTADVFDGQLLRDAGGNLLNPGTLTNDKEIAKQVALLQGAAGDTRLSNAKALALATHRIPLVQGAFDKAQQNNLALGTQTKQLALNALPGAQVGALQTLEGNGMGSSNLAQLAERGVRGDLTRAFQQIDAKFGDEATQLGAHEASTLSGINADAARIQLQGQGEENDITKQIVNALQHRRSQRKKGLLDVVGAAAPFIGAFAGGAPGAAVGALGSHSYGPDEMTDEGADGGN